MNKIIVENDVISFDNEEVVIESKNPFLKIEVKNNVVILDKSNVINLEITMAKDSTLKYYNYQAKYSKNIVVKMQSKANFKAKISLLGKQDVSWKVDTYMLGNNIKNEVDIKALSKDDASYKIEVNGHVKKNTKNNLMNESIQVLNVNGKKCEIIPNMLVSSKEVVANHAASIAHINENEIFYLQSKGILLQDAKKLIEEGFIKEGFEDKILQNI